MPRVARFGLNHLGNQPVSSPCQCIPEEALVFGIVFDALELLIPQPQPFLDRSDKLTVFHLRRDPILSRGMNPDRILLE